MRPWEKDPKDMTQEELLEELKEVADLQKSSRTAKAKQTTKAKEQLSNRGLISALKGLPREEQLKTLQIIHDLDTPELRKELGLEPK